MDEWAVTPETGADKRFYFVCKRCLDVLLASTALIFLSPLLLVIAILIKLDSPGSVLFVQERVGSRRRVVWGQTTWEICNFRMCKFRSMISNADQSLHKAYIHAYVSGCAEPLPTSPSLYKLTGDPRITRVGRILRKTSLDELPQLLNVLKGEMSIVGPRPVPTYEFEGYKDWHKARFAAMPGMTGLWQVKGRCQVPFEEQIQMDIEYVHHQSLWLDLKIMFWTIPAVVSARGAE